MGRHLRLLGMVIHRCRMLIHFLTLNGAITALADLVEESAETAHDVECGGMVRVVCDGDGSEDTEAENERG